MSNVFTIKHGLGAALIGLGALLMWRADRDDALGATFAGAAAVMVAIYINIP